MGNGVNFFSDNIRESVEASARALAPKSIAIFDDDAERQDLISDNINKNFSENLFEYGNILATPENNSGLPKFFPNDQNSQIQDSFYYILEKKGSEKQLKRHKKHNNESEIIKEINISENDFLSKKLNEEDNNKTKAIICCEMAHQLHYSYGQLEIVFFGLINQLAKSKSGNENLDDDSFKAVIKTGVILYYLYQHQLSLPASADTAYKEMEACVAEKFKEINAKLKDKNLEEIKEENSSEFNNFLGNYLPQWLIDDNNRKKSEEEGFRNWRDWMILKFRTRGFPVYANLTRLLIVRINREIVLLAYFLSSLKSSADGVGWFVDACRFDILSIVFYAPRLLVNLILFIRRVWFPETEAEKSVDWKTRFWAQWDLLIFQIGNDFVWLIIDLIVFFSPTPAKMPIIVLLYIFDVYNCWKSLERDLKKCKEAADVFDWGPNDNPYDISVAKLVWNYTLDFIRPFFSPLGLMDEDEKCFPNASDAEYSDYQKGVVRYCNEKLRASLFRSCIAMLLLFVMIPLGIRGSWIGAPNKLWMIISATFGAGPVLVNIFASVAGIFNLKRAGVNVDSVAQGKKITLEHVNPIPV